MKRNLMSRGLGHGLKLAVRLQAWLVSSLIGREFVVPNFAGYARWANAVWMLRFLGASVGERCNIDPLLTIQNAPAGGCGNLHIGDNVYIGPGCIFDLVSTITIEDHAAIGARVTVVTHADVGNRPLHMLYPRKEGGVEIGLGAWIGNCVTILHSVKIGRRSVVGAASLVRQSVPDECLFAGVPGKVVRNLDIPNITCQG